MSKFLMYSFIKVDLSRPFVICEHESLTNHIGYFKCFRELWIFKSVAMIILLMFIGVQWSMGRVLSTEPIG